MSAADQIRKALAELMGAEAMGGAPLGSFVSLPLRWRHWAGWRLGGLLASCSGGVAIYVWPWLAVAGSGWLGGWLSTLTTSVPDADG